MYAFVYRIMPIRRAGRVKISKKGASIRAHSIYDAGLRLLLVQWLVVIDSIYPCRVVKSASTATKENSCKRSTGSPRRQC